MDINLKDNHEKDNEIERIEEAIEESIYDNGNNNNNIDKEECMRSDNMPNHKKESCFSKTIWITLIILAFTIVSVGIYPPIKNILFKNHNIEQYLGSHDFAYTLAELTRDINKRNLSGKEDYYYNNFQEVENIKYYIKNTKSEKEASNIDDINGFRLQKEMNNSRFYLKAATDENSNVTIVNLKTTRFARDVFTSFLESDSNYERNSLANLEIYFFVPEKLSPKNDLLNHNMKNMFLEKNIMLILAIGGVGTLILMILAFATPYSKQINAGIVKLYNKTYLEFKLLFLFSLLMVNIGGINVISYNVSRNIGFDLSTAVYDANWYFYALGIPFTFTFYYLIYLSICYLKYIYNNGFIDGLIKNTMLGKLFSYMAKTIKDTIVLIIEVDDKNKYREKLIFLLGINLLFLGIIAFTFPFGWIFALLYSIVLFRYLIGVFEKIRILNKTSLELSKGNFSTILPEDMGILSPFSKNLSKIKEGFEIAIEREVKSQNMKTELITNVSHDLKTPLTSIITYIDLLKAEEKNEEMHKKYIDILDKKSKRLKVLIDDLFDVSKAASGNIELDLENLDVIALLRQTLGEMEEKINESSLQMKINLPEKKVVCELDGRKTYRVFENIINNILKYSMKNSRVYIDVEKDRNSVKFIFKNIAAYEMNFNSSDILERFIRGDASRSTDGSGLGLAISKSLVELQKGDLDIIIDGDLFKLIVTFPTV